MRRLFLVLSLLVLLSLACNLPGLTSANTVQPVDQSRLITQDPNATTTPTPFQPAATGQALTEVAASPTAAAPDYSDWSTPIQHDLKMPDGQINIMILGSDFRPGKGSRTDVMMLVSVNPKKSTVSVISFPRDIYVYLPGRGMDRLNTPYAYEGFPLLASTMEYNFGVKPDHYVLTNFYGFTSIINTLGGLNVNVGAYLSDRCDLPVSDEEGNYTVYPGMTWMDGDTALWYIRARHSTSDIDRTRREQEIMDAFFRRLMSLNAVTRAPEIYNLLINSVETDLTLSDLLPMVEIAPKLLSDDALIQRHLLGIDTLTPFVTEGGAQVLLPDRQKIWDLIKKAVYGQE